MNFLFANRTGHACTGLSAKGWVIIVNLVNKHTNIQTSTLEILLFLAK